MLPLRFESLSSALQYMEQSLHFVTSILHSCVGVDELCFVGVLFFALSLIHMLLFVEEQFVYP